MKTFITLLTIFLAQNAFSETDPCSALKATLILKVTLKGVTLIACAESKSRHVSDLTVLQIKGDKSEHLFDGDSAFKTYSVTATPEAIQIDEGLEEDKPFLRTTVSCLKSECRATPSACLWKKRKIENNKISQIGKFLEKKEELPADKWNELFYFALDGSPEAMRLLTVGQKGGDAEVDESVATIGEDLRRLKKAGCVK